MKRRHSLTYDLYMASPLWRLRRWWWFLTSDRRCEDCRVRLVLHPADLGPVRGQRKLLTVHHLTYRRLGHERRSDVALLCWSCHCRRDPRKRPSSSRVAR